MNKKKLGQALFLVISLAVVIVGLSYGSTLLFFHLNHLSLDLARPFMIWDYWSFYHKAPDKFVRLTVNACAFGPYLILIIVPILLLISKKQRSLHGDARFATLAEVRDAGLINPKDGLDRTILVGKFKNHYLTYGGYQFVMLAAPTRSGKGVGVVIPNCLNYSDSLVVLDIKLENFEITAGFRAAHGQEVYLFCPFDEHGRTHRYNPLEYISSDPAQRIGDIDAIGTALYSGGNENDKFWSENAKDLFRGLCLMVLEHPTLPKTLGEILRQASGKGKPFKDHIADMIEEAQDEKRPYSNACVDALNRITNNSENTLAGIVSTFNGPLLIFQNPRVDLATSANDFDLRDVRRKKMSIYLGVTPDKLKDAAVIVNLFFDQLLNLNTRVLPQQDKSLKYQCLLILDEFTSIGKVAMIQQAISYQAGYNMRVLTIIQNKSQLEDKYGKSGALTLMANHALMVMYAPSPVVQSDANEYSEMLGYQTVKSKNKSRSFASVGSKGSRSESESDQRRALMLPQEIKELGRWREIVSLENCKPILCDKIKYFEDKAFTSRTNWELPQIPVQNIDLFVAKLEERKRDLSNQDLNDANLKDRVVGFDSTPQLDPEDLKDLSSDELESLIDETASSFVEEIIHEPINKDQYRMAEDEAADIAETIFGGADDESTEEEAIEIVSENESSSESQAQSVPQLTEDQKESLETLSVFGFKPENTEEQKADEQPSKETENHEVQEVIASENEDLSQDDLNILENQTITSEKSKNKDEVMSAFGLEEVDEEDQPTSEQENQVLKAFGLESDDKEANNSLSDTYQQSARS